MRKKQLVFRLHRERERSGKVIVFPYEGKIVHSWQDMVQACGSPFSFAEVSLLSLKCPYEEIPGPRRVFSSRVIPLTRSFPLFKM